MADSSLSERDREFFLAEPHVAALSVSAGQGRGPLTVPIWYQYAPGGEAWVLTEAGSRKARLIEAAGRFTLLVERVMPTVWYVSVEGPVTRTVPGTDELLREIAARYLPPDKVPAYIEFVNVELGEQVAIYLRPERWLDHRGRRPPHSARSGAALDLVRLNSAAQTSGERRAASGEWRVARGQADRPGVLCYSTISSSCGAAAVGSGTTLGYGHGSLPAVRVERFVERRAG